MTSTPSVGECVRRGYAASDGAARAIPGRRPDRPSARPTCSTSTQPRSSSLPHPRDPRSSPPADRCSPTMRAGCWPASAFWSAIRCSAYLGRDGAVPEHVRPDAVRVAAGPRLRPVRPQLHDRGPVLRLLRGGLPFGAISRSSSCHVRPDSARRGLARRAAVPVPLLGLPLPAAAVIAVLFVVVDLRAARQRAADRRAHDADARSAPPEGNDGRAHDGAACGSGRPAHRWAVARRWGPRPVLLFVAAGSSLPRFPSHSWLSVAVTPRRLLRWKRPRHTPS